jgi:hypothetical protein
LPIYLEFCGSRDTGNDLTQRRGGAKSEENEEVSPHKKTGVSAFSRETENQDIKNAMPKRLLAKRYGTSNNEGVRFEPFSLFHDPCVMLCIPFRRQPLRVPSQFLAWK